MIAPPLALAAFAAFPAFAALAAPPPSGDGTVAEKVFRSAALGVDKHYWIYLPPGYATSNQRYPVVYMLHGLGGSESDWFGGADLALAAETAKLWAIIVTPDGDASFYVNWKKPVVDYAACLKRKPDAQADEEPAAYCVRRARYEDYIVKDLVKHVDATYRTIANRNARAIGGLSMGGFGALMLALRHHYTFSAAASHAGVISLVDAPPRMRQAGKPSPVKDVRHWGDDLSWGPHVRGIFGTSAGTWRMHDPAVLANWMPPGRLAIYIDAGTDDEYQLGDAAQLVHDVLTRRKADHAFTLVPGGRHDGAFWRARAPESLRFFAQHFRRTGVLP